MSRGSTKKTSWGRMRFEYDGFDELRTSDGMKSVIEKVSDEVVNEADNYPQPGQRKKYDSSVKVLDGTISAVISPATPHAANSNAKHNTLVKLLGRGDRV